MKSSSALRSQIEAALADRISSALTPVARTICEVIPTGIAPVDTLLHGGFPIGALTEIVGAECSGRTALALSFAAQITKAEKICAWVDVSNALSPESAAACGVDLARLLWVRCGVTQSRTAQTSLQEGEPVKNNFAIPKKYFVPKPAVKGLHGGGHGSHPRGEAKGMDGAVSSLLRPVATARCAEPQPKAWGEREAFIPTPLPSPQSRNSNASAPGRPWPRIEQALRATDLLLQAGGFGAIVLDLGSIAPEHVSRIPLATWFRYRAAAERTRACILLLTQYACSKSSAALVLRLESGVALPEQSPVLGGFDRRIEVSRQRFGQSEDKIVPLRKPPQRAGIATWRSQTAWAARL
jgi:hypothetical protein